MAQMQDITVPDIGDFDQVDVVEVLVKPGDEVQPEQPLITLESEKASLEVPSPVAGMIKEVLVKVGDKVHEGSLIARVEIAGQAQAEAAQAPPPDQPKGAEELSKAATKAEASFQDKPDQGDAPPIEPPAEDRSKPSAESPTAPSTHAERKPPPDTGHPALDISPHGKPLASPAVRKFARELGVDLSQVHGSGPHGRITQADVQGYVKQQLARPASTAGGGIPPMPQIDFSRFGEIETMPLSRIKRRAGPNLHRSWLNIPHVTQFDEADITELEAFRKSERKASEARGIKLTLLAFLLEACARALRDFPHVNSSLAPDGENLILKKYIHIGVAVDTEDGLLVPVIRDVNRKGINELARETAELAELARARKLKPEQMQGASFTISSLGGIGGTAFTPIINGPEVAILGVSRARMQPQWNEQENRFEPRLMLPLSFSYDHRVIDGADGARFTRHLAGLLGDLRRILL